MKLAEREMALLEVIASNSGRTVDAIMQALGIEQENK